MKPTSRLTNVSKAVPEAITILAATPAIFLAATKGGPFGYRCSSLSILRTLTTIILLLTTTTLTMWAQAGNISVTQSLTIEVKPITRLTVTGNPNPLIISDAVPGSNFSSVNDENTKYSLITNLENMKIVASINDRMPTGTRLSVKLSSSKAASTGSVDLSSALSPVDVVTGVSKSSDMNQSISYTFAANSDIYEIPTQTRVVTLTLTN